MSWEPKILNHNEQKRKQLELEQQKTVESVMAEVENVIPIGGDRFICFKCSSGWTFARMNTIECCGITYVKNQ